jgi:hypothetical protein
VEEPEFAAPLGGVDFVEPAEPSSPSAEARDSGGAQTVVTESAVELTPSRRRQIEVRIVEP